MYMCVGVCVEKENPPVFYVVKQYMFSLSSLQDLTKSVDLTI